MKVEVKANRNNWNLVQIDYIVDGKLIHQDNYDKKSLLEYMRKIGDKNNIQIGDTQWTVCKSSIVSAILSSLEYKKKLLMDNIVYYDKIEEEVRSYSNPVNYQSRLHELCEELEKWYDIDKIKSYSVYVWDKVKDENIFDIQKNTIVFYYDIAIPREHMSTIKKIQNELIE